MIKIKIGQLYSFHKDPKDPIVPTVGHNRELLITNYDVVIKITTINGFIGVTPIKDRTGWLGTGTERVASQNDIFHSGNYRLIWEPSEESVVDVAEEYGVDCVGCNKHYNYAVKSNDFKCWACRNGF